MRTAAANALAGSPENERWRRRVRRPTSAGWGQEAGCKAEPRAGEKRVRLCCRGKSAPRRSASRGNNRWRSPGRGTPCGAMPRRSVPLVRRLSEPPVRDSATVHAEHRSVPWPLSSPVHPIILRLAETMTQDLFSDTATHTDQPSTVARTVSHLHARVPSLFGVILVEKIRANDTQRRPHSEGRIGAPASHAPPA